MSPFDPDTLDPHVLTLKAALSDARSLSARRVWDRHAKGLPESPDAVRQSSEGLCKSQQGRCKTAFHGLDALVVAARLARVSKCGLSAWYRACTHCHSSTQQKVASAPALLICSWISYHYFILSYHLTSCLTTACCVQDEDAEDSSDEDQEGKPPPDHLARMKVRHNAEDLGEGETVIMTLADRNILDARGELDEDDADELENVLAVCPFILFTSHAVLPAQQYSDQGALSP